MNRIPDLSALNNLNQQIEAANNTVAGLEVQQQNTAGAIDQLLNNLNTTNQQTTTQVEQSPVVEPVAGEEEPEEQEALLNPIQEETDEEKRDRIKQQLAKPLDGARPRPGDSVEMAELRQLKMAYLAAERQANKGTWIKVKKSIMSGLGFQPKTEQEALAAKAAYEAKLNDYQILKNRQIERILAEGLDSKNLFYTQFLAERKKALSDAMSNPAGVDQNEVNRLQKEILTTEKRLATLALLANTDHRALVLTETESKFMHEQLDKTLDNSARDVVRGFTKWFNGTGGIGKAVRSGAIWGTLGFGLRGIMGTTGGAVTSVIGGLAHRRTTFDVKAMLEGTPSHASETKNDTIKGKIMAAIDKYPRTKKAAIVAALAGAGTAAAVFTPALLIGAGAGMASSAAIKLAISKAKWKVGDEFGAGGTYQEKVEALSKELEAGTKTFADVQREAAQLKFKEEWYKNLTNVATRLGAFGAGSIARTVLEHTDTGQEILKEQAKNMQPLMKGISDVIHFRNPFTGVEEEVHVPSTDTVAQHGNQTNGGVSAQDSLKAAAGQQSRDTVAAALGQNPSVDTIAMQEPHIDTVATGTPASQANNSQAILDKLFGHQDTATVSHGAHEVKTGVDLGSHPATTEAPATEHPSDANAQPKHDEQAPAADEAKQETPAPSAKESADDTQTSPAPKTPAAAPETTANPDIPIEAKIRPNDGITYAFMRQIEHDPKLQAALGYKPGDDLHSFARHEAVELAKKFGYITPEGEVRTYNVGAAYVLKLDGSGDMTSVEYDAKGGIIETLDGSHTEGGAAGIEKHEYFHRYDGAPSDTHTDAGPNDNEGIIKQEVPQGSSTTTPSDPTTNTGGNQQVPVGGSKVGSGLIEQTVPGAAGGQNGGNTNIDTNAATAPNPKALENVDFPHFTGNARYNEMLGFLSRPNSPALNALNLLLRDRINTDHGFVASYWFHGDRDLGDKFLANLYAGGNKATIDPVKAFVQTIMEYPEGKMSLEQKAVTLELMARAAENKLTPQFLDEFHSKFGFYQPPTMNNYSAPMLANMLGFPLRTDLESFEHYSAPQQAVEEKARATAAAAGAPLQQGSMSQGAAQTHNHANPGTHTHTNGSQTGNQQVRPAGVSQAASTPRIEPSYGTGGTEDTLYWDPKGGSAQNADALTKDQISNFNSVSRDNYSPEEYARLQKMGVLPQTPVPPVNEGLIKQEVPQGTSTVDERLPDGRLIDQVAPVGASNVVNATEGIIKQEIPPGMSTVSATPEVITQTTPIEAAPQDVTEGVANTATDTVQTDATEGIIKQEAPQNLTAAAVENAATNTNPNEVVSAFVTPENLHRGAQEAIERLAAADVFSERTLEHRDILAEKIFEPVLALGRSAENVANFYQVVAGDQQTYVPLRDFMTNDFMGEMPMVEKLQQQIHLMEQEVYGVSIMAYPENFSVHQWVESLVNKIAEKRSQ